MYKFIIYLINLEQIPEYKIRNIAFGAFQGLAYMHKNNFFHRDIKPENILISADQVKLTDFGLAKEINSEPPFTDYVATRWFRAPEVIFNSKTYPSPIDIFAIGIIISELYLNAPLFPGKNASENAINLLVLMLNFNPKKRSTAVKCLQTSFFPML